MKFYGLSKEKKHSEVTTAGFIKHTTDNIQEKIS